MNYALRGLLLLSPFVQFIFIGKDISTTLALSGITFSFLIFLLYLIGPKEGSVRFPWLWAWAFCHTVFLNHKGIIQWDYSSLHVSILYFIHISAFFFLYISIAQSKFDRESVSRSIGLVCIVMSVYSILQSFGIDQFWFKIWKNPGALGNPTNTAMYIAASSPFLLSFKRGWIYFILPSFAIICLASASATSGFLVVIMGVLLLKKYYARILCFCSALLIFLIFKFDYVKDFLNPFQKLDVWYLAYQDWKSSAWVGLGLGNFAGKYGNKAIDISYKYMHNHYFEILFLMGIIGFVCLVLFLFPILKNAWKLRKEMILPLLSVVSVGTMALCSVPMNVYPIVLLTAVNLGILTKEV